MANRNIGYINGIGICDHAWAVINAQAEGALLVYPRGRGVKIKELSIPTVTLKLNCWSIFNTIQEKEKRINIDLPNRFTTNSTYTVIASGNTYTNCLLISYNVEQEDKLWAKYSFEFTLGDQGTTDPSVTLKDGAGTEAIFTVGNIQLLGRTVRSGGVWHFWSHAFSSANTEWNTSVQKGNTITVKNLGGGARTINLSAWLIGPDVQSRKNLESYFISMSKNAVGRTGGLKVSGNTVNPVFLQSFSMSEEDSKTLTYSASFLSTAFAYS